jgi:CBS domain containing-hemolysin-like protein
VIDIQAVLYVCLILLIILDMLTSGTRSAYANSNLARLFTQRDQDEEGVNAVLPLIQSPRRLNASLNYTLVLTRFLVAGSILILVWPQVINTTSVLVAIILLLLASLLLFWMEWIVDGFVARSPESWAVRLATYARGVKLIMSPLLALPLAISRRQESEEDPSSTVTEDELKSMVDAGHENGVLEQDERKMIFSIFRLGDTLVREIMVPRIYVTALEADIPLPEAVDALLESGYSRVPVYDDSVDNILGVLYAKDMLRVWREGNQIDSLRSLLRPPYFVPEAKKVDELLEEMQARRVHVAIVVDEYGGIAGLVTLEDIVEEIVGEIQDEYDLSEELPYQEVSEGEYICQGRIDLDDFNDLMGTTLPIDEADTLGGYIYSRMGRVPNTGESLRVDDLLLTVEQVSGRRIRKVKAQKTPVTEGSKDETAIINR